MLLQSAVFVHILFAEKDYKNKKKEQNKAFVETFEGKNVRTAEVRSQTRHLIVIPSKSQSEIKTFSV